MRFIKLGLLSIILLFLLITIFSLFIPSQVRISKAIDIQASKEQTVKFLNEPVKLKEWYPGADSMDFLKVEGEIRGLIIDRKKSLAIEIITENDSMVIAKFTGPVGRKMESGWNIFSGVTTGIVTVQWWMDFRLRWYPWEKFSSLFFENIYGSEMEKGLGRLKQLLESNRSSLN